MSVVFSYGGSGTPGHRTEDELAYSSECDIESHPLTNHDSGIDIMSHESDSLDLPPTQDIDYQDASSSSDSRVSFSDALSNSFEEQLRIGPLKSSNPTDAHRRFTPHKFNFDIHDDSLSSVYTFFKNFFGASASSSVAIDNKIEQAMDLVKSHLMFAVREEVDVLKERIVELTDRIKHLECENNYLRDNATQETLDHLPGQDSSQLQ